MTKTEFLKKYKFNCKKCANCCTGYHGYIWINQKNIKEISKFLNITEQEFLEKYTYKVNNKISLKEIKRAKDVYDCIFLKNKRCIIYEKRPEQCRTYPFWEKIFTEKYYLDFVLEDCPGLEKIE